MRSDKDMIFIEEHPEMFSFDPKTRRPFANDNASQDVIDAIERLNRKFDEDIRRGEHRF